VLKPFPSGSLFVATTSLCGTPMMLSHTHYSGYSANVQQSKEELLVSGRSLECSESCYTAPPPPPCTGAPRLRWPRRNLPANLGIGEHDMLASSPLHPGPSSSNFSMSPAESETELEVMNNIRERWVFDAGSDCEKCPRSTSSTSCGSVESTSHSSSDETDTPCTLNSGVWPSVGSVGHPHMCAAPCKFAGKHSCKDGASCTRCHLCTWTRAKYRERVGAQRTWQTLSV